MSKLARRRIEGGVAVLDVERARDLLRDSRDVDQILAIRDAAKVAAEYRRITGAGREAVNEAQELVIRAQRKFGEFLREAGPKAGRPKKSSHDESISLKTLGVDRNESSRCQKLAAVPEPVFKQHLVSVQARGEKLTTAGAIAAMSHSADYDGDEWFTPAKYIEPAREVLGDIDLDPASCNHAQKTVRARRFFRKEDDGLTKPWKGRLWVNPPYSQPLCTQFIEKFIAEYVDRNVTAGLVLVNNATDTTWCQALLQAFPACFLDGRVSFEQVDGAKVGARQGQVVFCAGDEATQRRFVDVFSKLGTVVARRVPVPVEEAIDLPRTVYADDEGSDEFHPQAAADELASIVDRWPQRDSKRLRSVLLRLLSRVREET